MSAATILITEKQSALDLHHEAMRVSKDLKSHDLKLFEILLLIESRQIYYQFELPSLHTYCVELLELWPGIANDFINVVRKSLEVPELAAALRTQKLTVSKARKICSVLNTKNSKEWIDLAIHCSCRIVEKAVAQANPKEAVVETIKYVSGDALELKVGVSEEWTELLKKTKDLLSQKKCRNVTTEEALFILMAEYCQKNDPVEKASRAIAKMKRHEATVGVGVGVGVGAEIATTPTNENENPRSIKRSPISNSDRAPSRYRPRAVEHIIDLRDRNQCTYINRHGRRCDQKRWLNKHHVVEFRDGGSHMPENLEMLCWGHHKIRHLTPKS